MGFQWEMVLAAESQPVRTSPTGHEVWAWPKALSMVAVCQPLSLPGCGKAVEESPDQVLLEVEGCGLLFPREQTS